MCAGLGVDGERDHCHSQEEAAHNVFRLNELVEKLGDVGDRTRGLLIADQTLYH
jgi:hypothetical protein